MISLNTRPKYHEARNPAKEMNTIKHVDKSPPIRYYVNSFFILFLLLSAVRSLQYSDCTFYSQMVEVLSEGLLDFYKIILFIC